MAATSLRVALLPDATPVVDLLLAVAGAGVIAATAQVSITLPFTPVPITGQTLGVLSTAAALGLWIGAASSVLYVAGGLVGLPIFSDGSSGWHVLSGASGGYLIGFIGCALIIGLGGDRGRTTRFSSAAGTMLLGETIIYLCGLLWLRHVVHSSIERTFELGLYPFIVGDVLKIYAAAAVFPLLHRGAEYARGRRTDGSPPESRSRWKSQRRRL